VGRLWGRGELRRGMWWNVLMPYGRLRLRWTGYIKMDLEEMGLKVVDWIDWSRGGGGGGGLF
jgi:hypothetical protein